MLPEIRRFQQWLRRRNPHSSTHIHYSSDVNLFFQWSGKQPTQVSPIDVDDYITLCQERGHAVSTINRRLASLVAFYHFLDLMQPDSPPCPVIPRRHKIRQHRLLPRDVEDKDLEHLFSVVDNPRDRAMFILMLRSGLRVGEVRNLDMDDMLLHPSPGMLPRLWLRGKGGKQRVAYLSSQAKHALERWVEMRPSSNEDAVFLNRFRRRFTVTGIQDRLASCCHKAGIWVTCHQLRHSFARHLLEASVPVTTVQRLLGHARIRNTEAYVHISDVQAQKDYQAAMEILTEKLLLKEGT